MLRFARLGKLRSFRSLASILAVSFLAALTVFPLIADEQLEITLKEYRARKYASVSKKAYDRALNRAHKIRLGMRTDEFFDAMEMYMVRDKEGKPIDGFVEGYLQKESSAQSEKTRPVSVLIFGWYDDVGNRAKPIPRFTVYFQDRVLQKIAFQVASDDWRDPATQAGGT